MGDWLGTGTIAAQLKKFDFKKPQKFYLNIIKKNKIKSRDKLRKKLNNIDLPEGVASSVGHAFKNHPDYKGEAIFFGWGSRSYLVKSWSFKKARTYVHKLKLKSRNEWSLYCKNRIKRLTPKPLEIPSVPRRKYKNLCKLY